MAGFGDLFSKGSTAEQFLIWGVLQQVLQPLLLPFTAELQKLVLSATPILPIDAGTAAAAVGRGFIDHGTGLDKANDNGIGEHDFDILAKLAQHAPALSAAFELYRRKAIPLGSSDPQEVSLRGAFADAGLPDEWHDALADLATNIPSVAEVMNAWLEGQIGEAEARERYIKAGGDPTWFQTSYNANGQAPTPTQALELLNRGIIPERGSGPNSISYEQAFLEGPWRNKWLTPFLALAEYLPPPRTVTAMYHAGQIDHDLAAKLLAKQGLEPDLVTAYLSKASSTHTATEKHLAKGEITAAYGDGLLTRPQAVKALTDLLYSAHDADLILRLVDVKVKSSQLNQGIARVRTLYEAAKLTESEAENLLVQLGTDRNQAKAAVQTWRLTQATKTKVLSPAQIESAWYYGMIKATDALTLLQAAGYDEFDAWIALSVRNKGPITDVPRPASPFTAPKTVPPLPAPGA